MPTSFAELKIQELDRLRLGVISGQIGWNDAHYQCNAVRDQVSAEFPDLDRSFAPPSGSPTEAVLDIIVGLTNALEDKLPPIREKGHFANFSVYRTGWQAMIGVQQGAGAGEVVNAPTYQEAVQAARRKIDELASRAS